MSDMNNDENNRNIFTATILYQQNFLSDTTSKLLIKHEKCLKFLLITSEKYSNFFFFLAKI